jgi:DNA-binding XRE family transcriptional regulator
MNPRGGCGGTHNKSVVISVAPEDAPRYCLKRYDYVVSLYGCVRTEPNPLERDQSPLLDFYAHELRRVRAAAGLSQDALGKRLGYSAELVGKVENRERRPTSQFADTCDVAFPDLSGMFARLVCEAEQAHGVYPAWFASWVDAEQRAAVIRWWEPLLIPGLLQTADYARALFDAWQAVVPRADTDADVTARLDRQRIFDRPVPPSFWALLDETVLYRCVGSAKVMHDQLIHLVDMSQRPRVTVQVLPADVGAHVGLLGAFALATFGDNTAGIVYLESPATGETNKHPATVAKIDLTYETLRSEALGGRASRDLIRKVAEERWQP